MPDYKTARITQIDDTEFELLWAEGKHTVLHNFPWELFAIENQSEDFKKNYFRAFYNIFAARPDGILWRSELDGKVVALHAGKIADTDKGRLIEWEVCLMGYDANGERSWFNQPWATAERDDFWSREGVIGWRLKGLRDDSNNTILRWYRDNQSSEAAKGTSVDIRDPEAPAPEGTVIKDIDIIKGE